VTGDQSNSEGKKVVSGDVYDLIERLIAGFEISHKVTKISWKDRPFVAHQDLMKKLLKRSQPPSQPPIQYQSVSPNQRCESECNSAASKSSESFHVEDLRSQKENPNAEFDPKRGYLRYRARLVYGKIDKVMVCIPPNWEPDQRDLYKVWENHSKTPSAILEYWGHSYDSPPGPPNVKSEKTRRLYNPLSFKGNFAND